MSFDFPVSRALQRSNPAATLCARCEHAERARAKTLSSRCCRGGDLPAWWRSYGMRASAARCCSSARQRASGRGDPWRAGRQRLRDELRFEGAVRGVCACGRGIFALCHRGADVSDPRPCALRLRLCSTTRPFYPVAHFARPPTAGTATAHVEHTHSFGYASCGPIVGTRGASQLRTDECA